MKGYLTTLALASALLAAGCSTKTQVTLLPNADGKPSAVTVRNADSESRLDQPYAASQVGKSGSQSLSSSSAAKVAETYADVLRLTPAPAQKFSLEFLSGGTTLTPESQSQLQSILQTAIDRPGGEIIITGHTDTTGTAEANDRISQERANALRTLLLNSGFPPERIQAIGRGQRELLIATALDVDEPRNRRVEITVR